MQPFWMYLIYATALVTWSMTMFFFGYNKALFDVERMIENRGKKNDEMD